MSPCRARRWPAAGPIQASRRAVPQTPEIRLTADWVATAMVGTIVAGADTREFTGVSIDTRTLGPGELYIGIRGEGLDGADFAQLAIGAGAAGLVLPLRRGRAVAGGNPTRLLEG